MRKYFYSHALPEGEYGNVKWVIVPRNDQLESVTSPWAKCRIFKTIFYRFIFLWVNLWFSASSQVWNTLWTGMNENGSHWFTHMEANWWCHNFESPRGVLNLWETKWMIHLEPHFSWELWNFLLCKGMSKWLQTSLFWIHWW